MRVKNETVYLARNQYLTYGASFGLATTGSGAKWVQTYSTSYQPAITPDIGGGDPTNPFYPTMFTTSQTFGDSPGLWGTQLPGYFLAQTSLLVPGQNGGFTAAFTVMWGFVYSGSGQFSPIGPVVAPMWAVQQQSVGMVH